MKNLFHCSFLELVRSFVKLSCSFVSVISANGWALESRAPGTTVDRRVSVQEEEEPSAAAVAPRLGAGRPPASVGYEFPWRT